jgi:PTH1 family peptidyl-tRNA hydrolase
LPLFRRGEFASTLDLLVVGLGNPGRRHARDRHNVGFMVVDELARRANATLKAKFLGQLGEARFGKARVALLRPETFMNESGRSVQLAIAFYKAPLDAVLVVHDEVDLEHGRLQVRLGGGLAGHNGLRSIAGRLSSPDFLRLRVGVGRPGRGDPRDVAAFVLAPFAPEDDAEELVARAADAVESLVEAGLEATQQRFNERRE